MLELEQTIPSIQPISCRLACLFPIGGGRDLLCGLDKAAPLRRRVELDLNHSDTADSRFSGSAGSAEAAKEKHRASTEAGTNRRF